VQNVFVFWRGKQVSAYQKVSWTDVTSPKFLPVLMANDQYVRLTAEDEDGNFILVGLPDGDWVLGNTDLPNGVSTLTAEVVSAISGSNGWESDAAGNITSMDADYMNAILGIYNTEVYNFNLVAAPGAASPSVKIAIQNLCEFRHDCFGVVDATPFGIGLGIANGLNSVSEINDMNDSLSSSYVGSYFPWLKDTDADNKRYVWLPPSIYAITQMVYTDNIADPWFATAGLRRGMVPAIDVEYSATEAERDQIYGDTGLIINPIVKFVGEGIVIWGQKTAQRYASSTDRINVRRLLIYTEKLIATMARGFLFEQDESTNWNAFARQANAILEPIRQRKGLASYKVTCDITTNPSSITDQNIMAGIIEVVPIKTMEKIQVGFQIDSAGTVTITE
jgi:phage tail sheath protein FI